MNLVNKSLYMPDFNEYCKIRAICSIKDINNKYLYYTIYLFYYIMHLYAFNYILYDIN